MSEAVIVALAIAACAGAILFAVAWSTRGHKVFQSRLRRQVLIHRHNQPSIRGVLVEQYPDGVVLRHAEYLAEPSRPGEVPPAPLPLEGSVLVPHSTIDFAQELDHRAAARPAAAEPTPLRAAS